ncbi:MAG: hypothetical protein MMC33_006272 [Icmadophila ericetorum]|nr:hypothetical protein [Icmadophila ericetorum]
MPENEDDETKPQSPSTSKNPHRQIRWYDTPKPIKWLFNKVPLQILPPNELPHRTTQTRNINTLYIFARDGEEHQGEPSFNPSCLKWQAYLKFMGIDFVTVASNNHASPTGALPFLIPASSSPFENSLPIPSNKIQQWAREQNSAREEPSDMRYDAYKVLLDHRIRDAWTYTLYLEPPNFNHIATPLYIYPSTTSFPLRSHLSTTLRFAALTSLLSSPPSTYPLFTSFGTTSISPEKIYTCAAEAFEALSTLLGDDEYFFGAEGPGLLDAAVFAYTHLLLDDEMGWQEMRFCREVMERGNLVRHRKRCYKRFSGKGKEKDDWKTWERP